MLQTLLVLLVMSLFLVPAGLLFTNNKIRAVFKRNFLSYFSGVVGYLFIVAFVGLGAFWAFGPGFFANNLANLDQLNRQFPLLLLFIVPAITMTTWAEEKKQGTDELLFTLPATDLEILLGKYFAALGVYTIALLFSLLFCGFGVVAWLTKGNFDQGLILTNYLGYWISGAALLTAGMLASILTNSAPVAFILGAALCAIPVIVELAGQTGMGILGLLTGRSSTPAGAGGLDYYDRLVRNLSLSEQLRDFGLGLIPFSGILYFVSLAIFMLYLNLVMISKRHWSGGPHGVPMGMHYLVRGICLAIILIGFNVVANAGNTRLDLTKERLFTVFPTTRATLKSVKKERPIVIQAFVSPDVPGEYVATRSNLVGMLRQFDQIGGDRVKVRIVDTEQYSDSAEEARRFGIEPRRVQTLRGGKMFAESVYLGAVISSGTDDEVVIPFFDIGTPAEYELTRSIRTISEHKRLRVGVLNTDAKLFGGFDPATFASNPEWRIVNELKKQYEVEQVAADAPITGSYDVLIAAMPSSLTDPEMANFVEYVKRGKPTLIFDDPLPAVDLRDSISPRGWPRPVPAACSGRISPRLPRRMAAGPRGSSTSWASPGTTAK